MRITKGEGEVLHYYVSFFTPSTLVIQLHYRNPEPRSFAKITRWQVGCPSSGGDLAL